MYAEHKSIALESIFIELAHNRNDENQSRSMGSEEDRTDSIEGTIELKGNLDSGQRQRMLEIASRCFMHRTLSKGVDIRFRNASAFK